MLIVPICTLVLLGVILAALLFKLFAEAHEATNLILELSREFCSTRVLFTVLLQELAVEVGTNVNQLMVIRLYPLVVRCLAGRDLAIQVAV